MEPNMAHNPDNPWMINSTVPPLVDTGRRGSLFSIPTPDGDMTLRISTEGQVSLTLTGEIAPAQLSRILFEYLNTRCGETPGSWNILSELLRFGKPLSDYEVREWVARCERWRANDDVAAFRPDAPSAKVAEAAPSEGTES
jgi:hypothetical protein